MTDPGTPPPATPDSRPDAAQQSGYAPPPQGYPTPGQGSAAAGQAYATPGQSYGVPSQAYGAPAQAYGAPAPGYGAPASGRPSGSGRGLGIAALIVGVVPVLLSGIQPFFIQAAYETVGYASVELVLLLTAVLSLLLAAGAVVLGAFAVRRAGGAVLGGIGVGLGAATAIGVLLSFLTSVALYA